MRNQANTGGGFSGKGDVNHTQGEQGQHPLEDFLK